MNDVNLFSGKLVVQTLPGLTSGKGPDVPTLKRLLLPQGELAQFHDGPPPIHYIAALELSEGSVRGNHYHQTKVEHLYVMRGALELVVQEVETGERAQTVMQAGDLAIIQPGVAHAFRIQQSGLAIEFAPTAFDPADIHRHPLT